MFNLTEYDVQKIKDRTIYLESGCWDWKGTKDKDGYSIVWIQGKNIKLHRMSYFFKYGTLDPNLQVAHSCNNRYCFNPDHLYQATHQENIEYRCACERTAKHLGSKNGNSKLSEDKVRQIITEIWNDQYSYLSEVSYKYGISSSILRKILLGYYWKEVTNDLVVSLSDIRQKIILNK